MILRYVNSLGAEAVFDGDRVAFTERGELFDWQYERQMFGQHTAAIYRESTTFEVNVAVAAKSRDEAEQKADALFNVMAVDMDPLVQGRLYAGDLYVPCTLLGNAHGFSHSGMIYRFKMTFFSDSPKWIRAKPQQFVLDDDVEGLDYPHDYPFDYSPSWYSGTLVNTSPRPCFVRIAVEGPVANGWSVRIGDNTFSCTGSLDVGELMVVDGRGSTIMVTDALGNTSSAWSRRGGVFKEGSGSYIFEKVPSGALPLTWEGCNAVEVTVYEEYDEYPWRWSR